MSIRTLNPHDSPLEWVGTAIIPILQMQNWSTEKLSHLPQVAQLVQQQGQVLRHWSLNQTASCLYHLLPMLLKLSQTKSKGEN